ncbi:hypothetical protein DFJ74DRAFT_756519 [Hyaloraphidium curvatum]|nr:hypothetical protein DFJ74DRAFT_756519 [Hyaloraphidium curvatum]
MSPSEARTAASRERMLKEIRSCVKEAREAGIGDGGERDAYTHLRSFVLATRLWPWGWSHALSASMSETICLLCASEDLDADLRQLSEEDAGYHDARSSLFRGTNALEALCLPDQVFIIWDLTVLLMEDCGQLTPAACRALVRSFEAHTEHDRALEVLEWMGQHRWRLDEYKKAIGFYIMKRPMNVERARQVALDVGRTIICIQVRGQLGIQYVKNTPEVENASEEDKVDIMNHFRACFQERKWLDAVGSYLTLREHTVQHEKPDSGVSVTEVDNAMLEICKTYRKHSEAWRIYEAMAEIDARTLPIVIAVCHQAFVALGAAHQDGEGRNDGDNEKAGVVWMRRARQVYERYLSDARVQSYTNLRFVLHELMWIMSYDSEASDASLVKLSELDTTLASFTDMPIGDDYLAKPAIRICWNATGARCETEADEIDIITGRIPEVNIKAAELAFRIYQRIRERTVHGKYRRIRRCDSDIYVMMLELCTLAADRGKVAYMCQDALDAKVDLEQDLVAVIQRAHDYLICDDECPMSQGFKPVSAAASQNLGASRSQDLSRGSHNDDRTRQLIKHLVRKCQSTLNAMTEAEVAAKSSASQPKRIRWSLRVKSQ